MYLQEIFEVVIGLVFIWLVLSTATMHVGEWISEQDRQCPRYRRRPARDR